MHHIHDSMNINIQRAQRRHIYVQDKVSARTSDAVMLYTTVHTTGDAPGTSVIEPNT
jgi:hypothetical protein